MSLVLDRPAPSCSRDREWLATRASSKDTFPQVLAIPVSNVTVGRQLNSFFDLRPVDAVTAVMAWSISNV
jgi:hypothetical protein